MHTQHLLSAAKLRENACQEDLDYRPSRGLDRAQVASLALGGWIRNSLNLVLTGKTGAGKTYLACALANQACRHGMSVKFERVPLLLEDLLVARADHSFRRRLAVLGKLDLVILDDLGVGTLTPRGRADLLEVVECRAGRKSTLVTSQLPVKKWHDYLSDGNPSVADAILDRLIGGAQRIELGGDSVRGATSKSSKKGPRSDDPS